MKNLIKGLALLSMLLLLSCTKVIYTHEQVMEGYKTKEGIIKKFGQPDEKRTGDEQEEWLYKYDRPYLSADHSITKSPNTNTINVTEFGNYKKYIIFSMDMKGNVLGWKCEGVDFTERRKAPGKTIGLIAGGVALIAIIAWLASSVNYFPQGVKL